jgi:hypothetical protein
MHISPIEGASAREEGGPRKQVAAHFAPESGVRFPALTLQSAWAEAVLECPRRQRDDEQAEAADQPAADYQE